MACQAQRDGTCRALANPKGRDGGGFCLAVVKYEGFRWSAIMVIRHRDCKPLIDAYKLRQGKNLSYDRFDVQSDGAPYRCGFYRVKQHSLFFMFDLHNAFAHAPASLTFVRKQFTTCTRTATRLRSNDQKGCGEVRISQTPSNKLLQRTLGAEREGCFKRPSRELVRGPLMPSKSARLPTQRMG
jgi:hypothetical protein